MLIGSSGLHKLPVFTRRLSLPMQFTLRNTDLIFRAFSDEEFVVVFDVRNGDTHLLGEVARELFQLLAVSPATADELKRRLLQDFPDDDPNLIADSVDAALTQLESADFIFTAAN